MDPPDAPQPLPSARSNFDAVLHTELFGASISLSASTSASRLHPRTRPRRTTMTLSILPPSARRCARACKMLLESTHDTMTCELYRRMKYNQLFIRLSFSDISHLLHVLNSFLPSYDGTALFVKQPSMSFRPIYHLNLARPTGGVGVSPTELPATEAYGPPRPRGAARGKL